MGCSMPGIKVVGMLNIRGNDQIKRVYDVGGGGSMFIDYGWGKSPTEDTCGRRSRSRSTKPK